MKYLKLLLLILFISPFAYSQPKISFDELMLKAELNPSIVFQAEKTAIEQKLPVSIYIKDKAFIEAKFVENGKVVYAVITNFLHPFKNGYSAYFEDIVDKFDLSIARINYGLGNVVDNTGEPIKLYPRTSTKLLMIPDWTYDRVYAFDYNTGNLVDTAFIHSNYPNLQSPKHALQRTKTKILVSDQIADAVQEYDTNGLFVRTFTQGGNLDNIRGIAFMPNWNLLVTVASGTNQNTIQRYDTSGVHIGTFISTNLNSPFAILYRTGDILVTNSSGTEDVNKFNFSGGFIGSLIANQLNFPQQIINIDNGRLALCEFSGTGSGIKIYDSTGNLLNTLAGVTGNRGVFRLPNGNYLTTNSTGVYEIDDTTGALVSTKVLGSSFQYISVFDPDFPVSIGNTNIELPVDYKLYNNYPNPFNPSTKIKFSIPKQEFVTVNIYDNLGKHVKTLVNSTLPAGVYEFTFNADNLATGIYFYSIQAGNFSDSKVMVLIK
ncbi:MAG: T9SS type A sorting domain-containing protein [Ignavibacteria bacterium]|nr:T9SS type A sorting domain-containing protein [Ignavibacteria bacterium]